MTHWSSKQLKIPQSSILNPQSSILNPQSSILNPQSTAHCLLPTAHCLLPTAHCPLPTAHCPLPTAYCPLPTAHCPLPTAHCLLPTAYCLLPTAHCPLPTTAFDPPLPSLYNHEHERAELREKRSKLRSSGRIQARLPAGGGNHGVRADRSSLVRAGEYSRGERLSSGIRRGVSGSCRGGARYQESDRRRDAGPWPAGLLSQHRHRYRRDHGQRSDHRWRIANFHCHACRGGRWRMVCRRRPQRRPGRWICQSVPRLQRRLGRRRDANPSRHRRSTDHRAGRLGTRTHPPQVAPHHRQCPHGRRNHFSGIVRRADQRPNPLPGAGRSIATGLSYPGSR